MQWVMFSEDGFLNKNTKKLTLFSDMDLSRKSAFMLSFKEDQGKSSDSLLSTILFLLIITPAVHQTD